VIIGDAAPRRRRPCSKPSAARSRTSAASTGPPRTSASRRPTWRTRASTPATSPASTAIRPPRRPQPGHRRGRVPRRAAVRRSAPEARPRRRARAIQGVGHVGAYLAEKLHAAGREAGADRRQRRGPAPRAPPPPTPRSSPPAPSSTPTSTSSRPAPWAGAVSLDTLPRITRQDDRRRRQQPAGRRRRRARAVRARHPLCARTT
jgi:hypothetical protein